MRVSIYTCKQTHKVLISAKIISKNMRLKYEPVKNCPCASRWPPDDSASPLASVDTRRLTPAVLPAVPTPPPVQSAQAHYIIFTLESMLQILM